MLFIKTLEHFLTESIINSFEYDNVEYVDINIIKRFREFDRLLVPKYSKEDSDETIDNLVSDIKLNGIKSPLILDYFMYDNKALLIEGNHRLNAAILAGLKEVPVRVVRSKRDAPAKAISVRGFIKKHEHQHIPSDLKPSEIGICSDVINNN